MNTLQQKLSAAFAKHQAGDVKEAAALYRAVLDDDSQNPDALHMLGILAQQAGNATLALKLIEASLAKKQDNAEAWFNRSLVLRVLGRRADALQSAEQATGLKADYAEAWNMCGAMLREMNQPQRAGEYHRRALALKPGHAGFQNDYALALMAANDLPAAYRIMRDAVARDDKLVPLTLANILKSAGYPARALPLMQRTHAMLPENDEVRLNEATALLQMGDYAAGWEAWEQRRDLDARFHHLPFWRGEPVDHLLLYEDQGMGDALQCLRYMPMVLQHARHVTLQIAKPLMKLCAANFPNIAVIAADDAVPQADARLRLGSLPPLFKTRLDSIPATVPYIRAQDSERGVWRDQISFVTQPRIGIVWGGNPDNLNDYKRSLPFADLAPLLQAGDGHMISLQKGKHKDGAELGAFHVFDADVLLTDFSATAALMVELDLIVTTCTSTAHLAGAMGRPVWLMLCFDPHWLWLMGREDSPWYPTMRIFRQAKPYDWASVITPVAAELRKFIGGDTNTLRAQLFVGATPTQNPHALTLPED